jgi:charged multivesicular body protein 6
MGFGSSKAKSHHHDANSPNGDGRITPHDRAVLDLKVQRDRLQQYRKKTIACMDAETAQAKALLAQPSSSLVGAASDRNREKAKMLLRRRKYQQDLLARTETHLLNLEQLIANVEFAVVEKDVFDGLRAGTEYLKELQQQMAVEDVAKLMDETQEAIAYQQEISSLLSEHLTSDAELAAEQELEDMEAAAEQDRLGALRVPSSATEHEKEKEEEEEEEEKEKSPSKRERVAALA